MSLEELHHLSICMIEFYVKSLREHHSRDDHLSHEYMLGQGLLHGEERGHLGLTGSCSPSPYSS